MKSIKKSKRLKIKEHKSRKTKMDELKKIEFWENHYLNEIEFMLKQDINKMLDGLKSKDKIKDDWIEAFNKAGKTRQNSDFARGAERIYYWLFNQFGTPNSAPIGADMFFETYNAFVHIDIKTAKIDNPSDYKGKIPLGANQTSYKLPSSNFEVNLPTKYKLDDKSEKICLTYFLNIIYDYNLELENIEIKAIILICAPNGLLRDVYKNNIISAGKTGHKGKGFRYEYKNCPYFKLLEDKPKRYRLIYVDTKNQEKILKKLGLNE
ncbi:MAG: hypothetical protein HRF52_12215 [Ignavibacterium sp.]|jgi:hypothetical protein